MGYNWEKIFKEKDEKELLNIYSGNSHLDFEAQIFAGIELKNRNYDFDRIESIHKQKIAKVKLDIEKFKSLNYFKSKQFRNQILNFVGFVFIIIILLNGGNEIKSNDEYKYYELIIYAFVLLITVISAKWSFNRFKRKREETITQKIELLKKMSTWTKEN